MSVRVPTRLEGAVALMVSAQALRDAASALKRRRVKTADDRLAIVSWLYSRATRLTHEGRLKMEQ